MERGIRSMFNSTFMKSRSPVVVTEAIDLGLGTSPNVAFLRQDRIGDVLVATPLIAATRERYPDANISIVLSTNNVAVRSAVEHIVDDVLVYRKSLSSMIDVTKSLRQRRLDVIVDLLDNPSSTSSLMVSRSGARYAIGVDKENAGVYTHVVPLKPRDSVHISERISPLLLPLGISDEGLDLRPLYPVTVDETAAAMKILDLQPSDASLGIVLSGSMESKKFGVENTIRVIDQLTMQYPSVRLFIFGSPEEEEEVALVSKRTGATGVPPSSSFHEFATRLSVMKALWSPDTSTVHLASAWNLACCVMYSPDVEQRMPWYPYNTHCEVLKSDTQNIKDIPVEEVVIGIERLFAHCGFQKG